MFHDLGVETICVWTSIVSISSTWIRANTVFFEHGSLPPQSTVTISHAIGFDLPNNPQFYDRHEFEIVVNRRAASSRPGDHSLGD
jgi:hypothetical protein